MLILATYTVLWKEIRHAFGGSVTAWFEHAPIQGGTGDCCRGHEMQECTGQILV